MDSFSVHLGIPSLSSQHKMKSAYSLLTEWVIETHKEILCPVLKWRRLTCLYEGVGLMGKESACNTEDPSSIPGSGRSPGEGIGYPLQDTSSSLMAQLVKNPPAMRETWVWSLGWEDPLEKGKATHSSILVWKSPWTTVHGVAKSHTWLSDFHFHFLMGRHLI